MQSVIEWPAARRRAQEFGGTVNEHYALDAARGVINRRKVGFERLVTRVMNCQSRKVDCRKAVAGLARAASRLEGSDVVEVSGHILALACVQALNLLPGIKTWKYLWSMARESALLHNGLQRAVIDAANQDSAFKAKFITVASDMVKEAVANPGRRSMSSEKDILLQIRENWDRNKSLTDLWGGFNRRGPAMFDDDDHVLTILAEIDITAFMREIATFDNPYSLSFVLLVCGVSISFNRWKDLFAISPPAFNDDHTWNGSMIAPLLLYYALNELSSVARDVGRSSSDEVLQVKTSETRALVNAIAEEVAARPDANGCAERWATWLMRLTLIGLSQEERPIPDTIRARGFAEISLIIALSNTLPQSAWRSWTASDAQLWEHWCHRCVLVMMARSDATQMPSSDAFVQEWVMNPEDWIAAQGECLREKASTFIISTSLRADSYGARLLAIPLAEARDPLGVFESLWDGTLPLREAIEFQHHRVSSERVSEGDRMASELIQLVFGIGLMVIDCAVDPACDVKVRRGRLMGDLLSMLAQIVREMEEIDQANGRFWHAAFEHLAVRRVIWAGSRNDLAATFEDGTHPSFSDFLFEASTDAIRLLRLLLACRVNRVKVETVRDALLEAGISLEAEIATARKLMEVAQEAAGITVETLEAAEAYLLA